MALDPSLCALVYFRLTNFSNSAEDVYCHGNLAGVAYDVTAFNPQVGAAGMGETSALSLGFFYHVSEGDQVRATCSLYSSALVAH